MKGTTYNGTQPWMDQQSLRSFFVPAAYSAGLLKVDYGDLAFNMYVGQDLASTIVAF
jgi:hypothetical protein